MRFQDLFGKKKPVIACVHLLPLPGAPRFAGSMQTVYDKALEEADVFKRQGVNGLIVENFRDKPFFPDRVPAETVAALAAVTREIVKRTYLPVGVNALRNDAQSAIAIATAADWQDDIMLIVDPVLMAPLRREWKELQAECGTLKQDAETLTGKKRANAMEAIGRKLRLFADKIASIRVLDPACGSGNFLYIALRLLLDLQNDVINYSDQIGTWRFFFSVTPAQLYGIEINEYAYELAQMTIQIGYIQWLRDNGYGFPEQPILRQVKNNRHMDAVLAYDENSVAVWCMPPTDYRATP